MRILRPHIQSLHELTNEVWMRIRSDAQSGAIVPLTCDQFHQLEDIILNILNSLINYRHNNNMFFNILRRVRELFNNHFVRQLKNIIMDIAIIDSHRVHNFLEEWTLLHLMMANSRNTQQLLFICLRYIQLRCDTLDKSNKIAAYVLTTQYSARDNRAIEHFYDIMLRTVIIHEMDIIMYNEMHTFYDNLSDVNIHNRFIEDIGHTILKLLSNRPHRTCYIMTPDEYYNPRPVIEDYVYALVDHYKDNLNITDLIEFKNRVYIKVYAFIIIEMSIKFSTIINEIQNNTTYFTFEDCRKVLSEWIDYHRMHHSSIIPSENIDEHRELTYKLIALHTQLDNSINMEMLSLIATEYKELPYNIHN